MGGGDKEEFDKILIPSCRSDLSLSPASLSAIECHWITFDVSLVGNSDYHILIYYEIFDGDLLRPIHDLSSPRVFKALLYFL